MDIVISWVSKLVRPQWLGAYRFLWALGGGRWLRRWEEVKELVLSAELVADLTDPTPTATRAGVHSMSRRAGDQLGGTADADRRFWKRFEEDSTLLRVLKRTALQRAPLECRAAGAHHLCRGRCTQPRH